MKLLERWIYETMSEFNGVFTIDQLRDKIVAKKGNSIYIGSNTQIASYCKKYGTLVAPKTYRRK